jgi:hypothetical protein
MCLFQDIYLSFISFNIQIILWKWKVFIFFKITHQCFSVFLLLLSIVSLLIRVTSSGHPFGIFILFLENVTVICTWRETCNIYLWEIDNWECELKFSNPTQYNLILVGSGVGHFFLGGGALCCVVLFFVLLVLSWDLRAQCYRWLWFVNSWFPLRCSLCYVAIYFFLSHRPILVPHFE